MEVEVETTKRDYLNFYKDYFFRRGLKKSIISRLITIFLIIFVFSNFETGPPTIVRHSLIIFFSLIAFYIMYDGIYYLIYASKTAKLFAENDSIKRKFIISSEGVLVESVNDKSLWRFGSIKQADVSSKYIFINLLNNKFYLIPKRFFSSENEAINFLGIIKNAIPKTKDEKPKYVYYWGILCLVPVLGAIAGAVLIIVGVYRYKNIKVVLLGVIGVLATVGYYCYMNYTGFQSKEAKKMWAQQSQSMLNILVKDVEFYKLQNGVYPDSLEQVKKNNSMAFIEDPLLMISDDKKNVKFNYKRIGNKYLLFSSGIDGIPSTKDDIYPSISNPDSSKLGFIRR